MKKARWLIPWVLAFPTLSSAAILWDGFTVTVDDSSGTPTSAIVDVVNLHWTGVSPAPTSAQLQDLDYLTTLYFFSGVQQSSTGTVVPNEQAFFTFDPTLAAEVLDAYQTGNLYIGLYNGPTFLDGLHADGTNSTLDVITPEPSPAWPMLLVLALAALWRYSRTLRRPCR